MSAPVVLKRAAESGLFGFQPPVVVFCLVFSELGAMFICVRLAAFSVIAAIKDDTARLAGSLVCQFVKIADLVFVGLRLSMQRLVLAMCQQHQIRQRVISRVSIYVVDMLFRCQGATEMFLHHGPRQRHMVSIDAHGLPFNRIWVFSSAHSCILHSVSS